MTPVATLRPREVPPLPMSTLIAEGVDPLLARVSVARGATCAADVTPTIKDLLHYNGLKSIIPMAKRLSDAIQRQEKIVVVADYDADGATACAVAVRGFAMMGLSIDFMVPNRFLDGYGLTPGIVEQVSTRNPDIILTVDNGIASTAGVECARKLGIEVLVTDHHLPGDSVPDTLIVNPNQTGCEFESKHLAGVGVMFYVLMAIRAELTARGHFSQMPEPPLIRLLDIVALGTVADVVRLDRNNRILVERGLRRMRSDQAHAGIAALFSVAGRDIRAAASSDLGFTIGPRINAAGRLDDMTLGIRCLVTDDKEEADDLARQLHQMNALRRKIETQMQDDALEAIDAITADEGVNGIAMYHPDWHQGVIGIVASRLKDRFYRPVICFAAADGRAEELKGSGRSIPGFHLRDILDVISKRDPRIILKFGGHAMAAGLTIEAEHLEAFRRLFDGVIGELMTPEAKTRIVPTDGALSEKELTIENAKLLMNQVWGQGFEAPTFLNKFAVIHQSLIKDAHLKLRLRLADSAVEVDSILFNRTELLGSDIQALYQLDINAFRGREYFQIKLVDLVE